jgi:hypothetical protein
MNSAPTKATGFQPTPAIVRRNGTKAHASFSGNSNLNAAQKSPGVPTIAVVKRNRV